jgi:hypothetical protein
VFSDSIIEAITDVPALSTPSLSLGILLIEYQGASGAGGEATALDPSCASNSCGPIVFGPGGAIVSPELVAGGEPLQIFIDLPVADFDMTPSGAPGVSTCALRFAAADWQALAHTVTFAFVDCEAL